MRLVFMILGRRHCCHPVGILPIIVAAGMLSSSPLVKKVKRTRGTAVLQGDVAFQKIQLASLDSAWFVPAVAVDAELCSNN